MNHVGTTLDEQFAEQTLALDAQSLSGTDIAQLKQLVVDHLAVCLGGASLPWSRALQRWASASAGSGNARVFGTDLRMNPSTAALLNGAAAHGMELDDTHDASLSHPGAVVISAALAVGMDRHCSGQEVLAAIAAGYEVMARVGMAAGAPRIIEDGFHPTALFGSFGATAAAGKLLGLSTEQLCSAWGLALSSTGGSTQFSQESAGTTVKRMHGGYAAQNGVVAAEHAALGIAGPHQAFSGRYGFFKMFGNEPEPSVLLRQAHEALQIHHISLKPYPCCRLFHSTLDALAEATGGWGTPAESIATITVGGPEVLLTQHMLRRPTSEMAAQYSLPFALATSLLNGAKRYDAYAGAHLEDADILALGDRVECVFDEGMQAAYPAHFGSWVEVEKLNGERTRADVLDSYGTPARPMPLDSVIEKAQGLIAGADAVRCDPQALFASVQDMTTMNVVALSGLD
ncbi:MAG: MmgE/PrpD family protein [Gammaproteobacteria bacterium]|nr:MmgE/PrpD family protein [Gammaproteobacteria bacterium]